MVTTRMLSDIRDYVLRSVSYARIYVAGQWIVYENLHGRPEESNKIIYELPIERNGQVTKVELYGVGNVLWDDRNESFTIELIKGTDALIYQLIYTISVY